MNKFVVSRLLGEPDSVEGVLVKLSRMVFFGVVFAVVFLGLLVKAMTMRVGGVENGVSKNEVITVMDQAVAVNSDRDNGSSAELVETQVTPADARPVLIRKYLTRYKSPLLPYSDLIFELSQTYGFDYYWIIAIGQQESNLCKKIPENSYNCWGYGIHKKGTLRFENYELALKSYAEYLKREYFDKGLNTPELIMKKYCPSSNGSWAKGVNQFIREIETGDF